MNQQRGRILVLSGKSECGKTTTIEKILESLTPRILNVRGVLCPAVIQDGEKCAIDIIDLATGESRRLAERNSGKAGGISTTRWDFDSHALNWGNDILEGAVPCDLLVVDELGPLEFERGQGFLNGLLAIDSRNYQVALVVIRASLLEIALQRWKDALVYHVTRPKQDHIISEIIDNINDLST